MEIKRRRILFSFLTQATKGINYRRRWVAWKPISCCFINWVQYRISWRSISSSVALSSNTASTSHVDSGREEEELVKQICGQLQQRRWASVQAATRSLVLLRTCNTTPQALFRAFMTIPQSKPAVFNLVMNAYVEVKMIAEAAETFYVMKEHGILPSLSSCNFLLQALVVSRKTEKAWENRTCVLLSMYLVLIK